MRILRIASQRLRSLFGRDGRERELEAEIALHIEALRRELMSEGMGEADAAREARKRFGPLDKTVEECRDQRRVTFVEDLARDAGFAVRMFRKSPGFTLTALASLVLGVGANTSMFQFFEAVRLRALPVERPEELMTLRILGDRSGSFRGRNGEFSYAMWDELARRQRSFSGLAAYGDQGFNLAPSGEIRNAMGLRVSGDFFNVLGVRPQLGRLFTEEDDRPGCGWNGAVVSHAFWQREMAGDPRVLSRVLTVDGNRVPVVGVTPSGFFGVEVGRSFDVAVPICTAAASDLASRSVFFLSVIGRLRPEVSMAAAQLEMRTLSVPLFDATLPTTYLAGAQTAFRAMRLEAKPGSTGKSEFRESLSEPLGYLLAMVALVLLLACANLANMMLARATSREHEFAVRRSMGATQFRLIQQVLVESVLLSAAGAVIGSLAAPLVGRLLVSMLTSPNNPITVTLDPNLPVLLFTLTIASLATILFGLAPALRAARANARGASEGKGAAAFRRILLGTQVALSMVLLTAALLFSRSFQNLHSMKPGFDPSGVLIAHVFLNGDAYPPDRRPTAIDDLSGRLQALPGVTSVARASVVPVSGSSSGQDARLDGTDKVVNVRLSRVSHGYLGVMRMPILAGRDFTSADTPQTPPVAIVNEAFARALLEGGNPIGRTIRLTGSAETSPPTLIVGLTADSKYASLTEGATPILYLADHQRTARSTVVRFVIRTSGDPGALTGPVRQLVDQMDPQLSLRFSILESQLEESVLRERLMAAITGAFGTLGMALALSGVFGVTAYMVSRRHREFGVRVAMGATHSKIVRMILRDISVVLAAGVAVGGVIAFAAGGWMSSSLYGIPGRDVSTLLIVTLVLGAGGLLAGFIPALRASRVDPVKVLRLE